MLMTMSLQSPIISMAQESENITSVKEHKERFNASEITSAVQNSNVTNSINQIPANATVKGILVDTLGNSTTLVEGKENLLNEMKQMAENYSGAGSTNAVCVETLEVLIEYSDGSYEYYYVEVWYAC